MSCLIVGCGYLGRRIGAILLKRGEAVYATTRTAERGRELKPLGIIPLIADVLKPDSFPTFPTIDRVFYCVGYDRSAGVSFRVLYRDGLQNMLKALKNLTPRIVYASSTGVYGQDKGEWVDEESPTEPTTESGKACLDAERTLAETCLDSGIEYAVIRYSGLYGPGRMIRRSALERGEPIAGDPGKFLNLIHIQDAAIAAIAVLDAGTSGRTYLASDDQPVPRRSYYQMAAALLQAPSPSFVDPQLGNAIREEPNKRILNRRIKEELGFKPTYPSIVEGLPASLVEERSR